MGLFARLRYYFSRLFVRNSQSEALTELLKGIEFHQAGDFQSALEANQRSLRLYRVSDNMPGEGAALGNLGLVHHSLGNYSVALDCHQQSLNIAQQVSNVQSEASALDNLGLTHFQLGRYDVAAECHEKALTISKSLDDMQGVANALGNIGMVFDAIGQYSKSMEYHQQSLEMKRELGDRQGEASTLGNIGIVYYSTGQYLKAIQNHQQHLSISQELGDQFGEGTALSHIGNTYYLLGQPEQAISHYQKHLTIARSIGDTFAEASVLTNLGNGYQMLLKYTNSVACYQGAIALIQKMGDAQGEACAYNSLGAVHLLLGDLQPAVQCFEKAFEIANRIGDLTVKAAAMDGLGNASQLLGNFSEAIKLQSLALAINEEIGDLEGVGTSANNLGNTLIKAEEFSEAERIIAKGIHAWESLRSSLQDLQKISLMDTQKTAYALLQEALVKQQKYCEALVVSERSRTQAFIDLLRDRALSTGLETPASQISNKLINANAIQNLAQLLNITLVEYSIVKEAATLIYVWVVQPSGEILFESINFKTLLQSQNVSSLRELISKLHSGLDIQRLHKRHGDSEIADISIYSLLQSLHQYLIQPIAEYLPSGPDDVVAIVPQSDLFLIPFQALQDDQQIFLLDKHTLVSAPSIQSLELLVEIRSCLPNDETAAGTVHSGGSALVVGNPTMPTVPLVLNESQSLANLPGAEAEAKAIAALLNVECLSGEAATKAAIFPKLLSAQRVHLATHALLDDIRQLGMPGAIALSPTSSNTFEGNTTYTESKTHDGFLRSDEIITLKMTAELVVLSACVTGLGKLTGDGVVGLSRSFMAAGVPRLIVSLQAVSDVASAPMMVKLHQLLNSHRTLKSGDAARALRKAQIWLRTLTTAQAKAELSRLQPYIDEAFCDRPQEGLAYVSRCIQDLEDRAPYPFASPAYWSTFVTLGL